jgi:hypothetical protein
MIAVGLPPCAWKQRRGGDEIDDQEQSRDESGCGDAACERHEDHRRTEPGEAARRAGYQGDGADRKRGVGADIRWNELRQDHVVILRMTASENRFTRFGIMRAARRRSSY